MRVVARSSFSFRDGDMACLFRSLSRGRRPFWMAITEEGAGVIADAEVGRARAGVAGGSIISKSGEALRDAGM